MCPQAIPRKAGLLTLPAYVNYWLLSSDLLKVEDENTVLSFIFHYSNLQKEEKGLQRAIEGVNMLTKCLRFNFLDLHNLLSATRKNVAVQQSAVMSDTFRREFEERLKLGKPSMSQIISKDVPKPEEELHFCGRARKYFNTAKVEGQGRYKLLKAADTSMAMAGDLLDWAFESKI